MEVETTVMGGDIITSSSGGDGSKLYPPENTGPVQLQQTVNTLHKNEEKVPDAFFISTEEIVARDSPKLVAVLKEMKDALDGVRAKVQFLTQKVKDNEYPTADGISYLEAKHLLLIGYCQNIVYYVLRKAKGLSISGHPLVQSLVEIRLFLEKIRPIDKKVEYEVQKLLRAAMEVDRVETSERKQDGGHETDDPLKYRPNPDMLVSKTVQDSEDAGVYRPPRFAPMAMDEDKISKEEKQAMRKEKEALRRAKQGGIVKEYMDDLYGRPEEIKEFVGSESREFTNYKAKWEERARQEEELFVRAPISKQDKKKERHLLKRRDGLMGLTESFYNELGTFDDNDNDNDDAPSKKRSKTGKKTYKRKRKH